MREPKVFYYSDELNDDFAATKELGGKPIGEDFPYIHKNPLWRAAAALLYRGVVTPVVFLYCKLLFGLRIKGKKQLRGLKNGYFLYANHTQHAADAFIPSLVCFPKKAYIVTGASAVSIPGLRNIVQMLGAIPLPDETKGLQLFSEVLKTRISQGAAVCIYPEAHIWPYYTHIRPFRAGSFAYPADCGAPVVPYVVTYRERRLLKRLHPCITVQIGKPIFPDRTAPNRKERHRLRNEAYAFMTETAERTAQPEYIRYIRKETE
ncbi:MAG: lysophospholipid acyltransferase family protein [Faecousia sp.]